MNKTIVHLPFASADANRKDDAEKCVEDALARHGEALRRFLSRALRPDEDVEDVLQEICLRLLNRERLNREHESDADNGLPRAYIFVVATNIIRDMRRKGAVRTRAHKDPVFMAAVNSERIDPEPSVEESLSWQEGLDIVQDALGGLKPKYVKVFLLRWRDGLTFPQISKQTGIPVRTVERYASHALGHCKRALERRNWTL